MRPMDNIHIAVSIDEQQERDLAVDLRNMAFIDTFRENRLSRLFLYFVDDLFISDPDPKFNDIEMARVELRSAMRRQIDIGVVGQNPLLLESLSFPAHSSHIHSGQFTDAVVGFPRITNQVANNRLFLLIQSSHGNIDW